MVAILDPTSLTVVQNFHRHPYQSLGALFTARETDTNEVRVSTDSSRYSLPSNGLPSFLSESAGWKSVVPPKPARRSSRKVSKSSLSTNASIPVNAKTSGPSTLTSLKQLRPMSPYADAASRRKVSNSSSRSASVEPAHRNSSVVVGYLVPPPLTSKSSSDSIASLASSRVITPKASFDSISEELEEIDTHPGVDETLAGISPRPDITTVQDYNPKLRRMQGYPTSFYNLNDLFSFQSTNMKSRPTSSHDEMTVDPLMTAPWSDTGSGLVYIPPASVPMAPSSFEDFSWILNTASPAGDAIDENAVSEDTTVSPSVASPTSSWPSSAAMPTHQALALLPPATILQPGQWSLNSSISGDVSNVTAQDWHEPIPPATAVPSLPESSFASQDIPATYVAGTGVPAMRKSLSSDNLSSNQPSTSSLFAIAPQSFPSQTTSYLPSSTVAAPSTPPNSGVIYQAFKDRQAATVVVQPSDRAGSFDDVNSPINQQYHRYSAFPMRLSISAEPTPRSTGLYRFVDAAPVTPLTTLPLDPSSQYVSYASSVPTYSTASVLRAPPQPLSSSTLQPIAIPSSNSTAWVSTVAPKAPRPPRAVHPTPPLTSTPLSLSLSRLGVNSPAAKQSASSTTPRRVGKPRKIIPPLTTTVPSDFSEPPPESASASAHAKKTKNSPRTPTRPLTADRRPSLFTAHSFDGSNIQGSLVSASPMAFLKKRRSFDECTVEDNHLCVGSPSKKQRS